jgi:uncharacterized protein YjiS (DUF1127 family)
MALVHGEKCAVESSRSSPRRWLAWLIAWLREWHRAADDRHYLAGLSDHDLRDLGLSRLDVDQGSTFRDRLW